MFHFFSKKSSELEPETVLDFIPLESLTKESDYLKKKREELIANDAASAKPKLLIHGRKKVNLLSPTVLKVKKSKKSLNTSVLPLVETK